MTHFIQLITEFFTNSKSIFQTNLENTDYIHTKCTKWCRQSCAVSSPLHLFLVEKTINRSIEGLEKGEIDGEKILNML